MKISLIIPVYNVERYLARCLDSVLAQTERDFEAICVDDGSTDGSHKILLDYAMRDKRIRIYVQENKGLSGARNTGLDAATGEWVAFLDPDDYLPPNALATFLRVAEESGESVVVSAYYEKDSHQSTADKLPPRWKRMAPALKQLVGKRKMQSSAWNKFYRADLLKNRRFIEGIYFEDWPFVTELFGDLASFALVEAPCYVYCTNGDAASIVRSPFNEKKAASYRAGIDHVTRYFASHPQRKWAMKRVAIAQKMLEKRLKRSSAGGNSKPFKFLEDAFHSIAAAIGAWKCLHLWKTIDKKKIVFNQFQGSGFGCNPKYIALELLRRRKDLDLVWLVRNPGEGGFPAGIRTVAWKSPAALKELATAKVWVSNHTLGAFVKHRGLVKKPGQVYLQTWHGSFGIKRCPECTSRKEAQMMDAFIVHSRWEAERGPEWFPGLKTTLPLGHARNDILVQAGERSHGDKTLLYVPTFRDDGALDAYLTDFEPILAALKERWPGQWRVQIRLHPNMKKKGIGIADFALASGCGRAVADVTAHPDIQELMRDADVVISDYSSCIFDFALTRRPAFIYAPDRREYEAGRGLYFPLADTPFPVAEDVASLAAAIRSFEEAPYRERLERFFADMGSVEDGHAAERIADCIEKELKS